MRGRQGTVLCLGLYPENSAKIQLIDTEPSPVLTKSGFSDKLNQGDLECRDKPERKAKVEYTTLCCVA